MAIKPYVPRGGTLKLSSSIYDGPYKVERYMPGFRTVRLTRQSDGLPRLAHIDNLKSYIQSNHRDPMPETPDPQPSEDEQRRALDTLERACRVAQHVVGQGRARATVSSILGQSGIAPVPPQIQQLLDQHRPPIPPNTLQARPSSSRRPPEPSNHQLTSKKARFSDNSSQASVSQSSFQVIRHTQAPWKPHRNDLSSWFDNIHRASSPPSSPSTRYGRTVRHRFNFKRS